MALLEQVAQVEPEATPVDFEEVVSTVTRLWANALRFPGHR
ncbi:hypothetical protein [Streptomyces sp. NPDC053427]